MKRYLWTMLAATAAIVAINAGCWWLRPGPAEVPVPTSTAPSTRPAAPYQLRINGTVVPVVHFGEVIVRLGDVIVVERAEEGQE